MAVTLPLQLFGILTIVHFHGVLIAQGIDLLQDAENENGIYERYYLSASGTDNSTCGTMKYSPCKTLDQVLNLYYNQVKKEATIDRSLNMYHSENGLDIRTTESLIINSTVIMHYPLLRKSRLKISFWIDDILTNKTDTTIPTITIDGVSFLESEWDFENLNTNLTNSETKLLDFKTRINDLNYRSSSSNVFHNSVLGSWTIIGLDNTNIINCSAENMIDHSNTLMIIQNSTVMIENSSVNNLTFTYNNTGIVITNSAVVIKGSEFTGNNMQNNALIVVRKNSTLTLEDSSLGYNKAHNLSSSIFLHNSTAFISSCSFRANSARNGGAITLIDQAVLYIRNSSFIANNAANGGALYGDGSPFCHIEDSVFVGNVAGMFFGRNSKVYKPFPLNLKSMAQLFNGGAIECTNNCTMNILNSQFVRNKATGSNGGAIAAWNYGNITCHNCSFSNNTGYLGAALFTYNNTNLEIADCIFTYNKGQFGTVFGKVVRSLEITNCTFTNNLCESGGAVAISSSSSKIIHSRFRGNIATGMGGAISIVQSNATISSSLFESNIAKMGAALAISETGIINILSSKFTQNIAFQGGALFSISASGYRINNSIFTANKACNITDQNCLKPSRILSNLKFTMMNTAFYNNIATSDDPVGGAIYCTTICTLNIINSLFRENNATKGGAIATAFLRDSICLNCSFSSSTAAYGAAFSVSDCPKGWASGHLHINGCTFANNSLDKAGAVYIQTGCNVTINDTTFSNNIAENEGAAIAVSTNGSTEITNSSFISNTGKSNGGAIVIQFQSNATIIRSHFQWNKANLYAGAIEVNFDCNVIISETMFDTNIAGNTYGGALYIGASSYTLCVNCTYINNTAKGSGGAIYAGINTNIQLEYSNFLGNKIVDMKTSQAGGAIYVETASSLTMKHCILKGNQVPSEGGAISITDRSKARLLYSQLVDNNAKIGGAIDISKYSYMLLFETTFQNNSAISNGGALNVQRNSSIYIGNSSFAGNRANYGGALYFSDNSELNATNVRLYNNFANFSGVIELHESSSTFSQCQIYDNQAAFSGDFARIMKSIMISINSAFESNGTPTGSHMVLESGGQAYFQNCTIQKNKAVQGGAVLIISEQTVLKISQSIFAWNFADKGMDISYHTLSGSLVTYQSKFVHKNITLNTTEQNFKEKAIKNNIIYTDDETMNLTVKETQYASIEPRDCSITPGSSWNSYYSINCNCYYSIKNQANILNCSNTNMTSLPKEIFKDTNWLLAGNNNLGIINHVETYLKELTRIDMSRSNITNIDNNFIQAIKHSVKYLNIASNKMENLPTSIADMNAHTTLYISENPYKCNCGMLWMRDWLVKATNVEDRINATCKSGTMIGKPIYLLDKKAMGCIFPLWTIALIAILSLTFIVLVVIVNRKWDTIKFLMFVHFNVLTNDDPNENLDEMDFDCYVTYSQFDKAFVLDNVINFLEDDLDYKLCIHERDFQPGAAILSNIEAAVKHSRRMIMVISDNYAQSGWCMEEFRIGHSELINGRKGFLIPILCDETATDNLDASFKMYIDTHTYIDANDLIMMKKKLHYVMPRVPLCKLKPAMNVNNEGDNLYGPTHVEDVARRINEGGRHNQQNVEEDHIDERTPLIQ